MTQNSPESTTAAIRAPVAAIMLFQVAALVSRAYAENRLVQAGETREFAHDLSFLVVPPILAILMFPLLSSHARYLVSMLRRAQLTVALIGSSLILGLILRIGYWCGLISLASIRGLGLEHSFSAPGPIISFVCPEPVPLALAVLVMVCLVPVVEETVHRGLILPALLARGRTAALMLSSALFAVVHDPQAMPIAFLVGLFLGTQRLRSGTLWAPLLTHAGYNAVAILDWRCLNVTWTPAESLPRVAGTVTIAAALAAASIWVGIMLARRTGRRGA